MSEKYIQFTTERSNLQITTSKEGLIVTLANRSLCNGEWTTMILNEKQTEGMKKFFAELSQ